MAVSVMLRAGVSLEGLNLERYADAIEIAKRWAQHPESFEAVFWNDRLRHKFTIPKARSLFEPPLPGIYDWKLSLRAAENLKIEAIAAPMGLLIENADYVALYGDVRLKTTRDYVCEFELEYQCSPDNRAFILAMWRDEEGKVIRNDMLLRLPNNASGHPYRFSIPVRSPEAATHLRLRVKTEHQYPGDFLKISQVQVHAGLSRLKPEVK
jgi:hypothetical protein